MNRFMSKIFKSSLISSIALSILGILLIFESEATIVSISYIIGGILVTMGILGIMRYFYSEINSPLDVVYGVVTIVMGIVVIINPHAVASIIPFIIGIVIIISSVTKIQYSITLNRRQNHLWKSTLILSMITLIFGLFLIFNPFAGAVFITKLVGGIILVYGILDVISTMTIHKTFKQIQNALEENVKEAEIIEEESDSKEKKNKKEKREKDE